MSQPITGNQRFPTNKQVPDHAIMDFYNKQAYLGNQYLANTGAVSLSDTAEHPLFYLLNPATASVSLFNSIRKLFAGDLTNTIVFRIYISPTTVASGTAITPTNCRFASSNLSVATAKKSPTAVSNGTLIATLSTGIGYMPNDEMMLILDPGQAILITAQGSAATTCVAEAVWYEL